MAQRPALTGRKQPTESPFSFTQARPSMAGIGFDQDAWNDILRQISELNTKARSQATLSEETPQQGVIGAGSAPPQAPISTMISSPPPRIPGGGIGEAPMSGGLSSLTAAQKAGYLGLAKTPGMEAAISTNITGSEEARQQKGMAIALGLPGFAMPEIAPLGGVIGKITDRPVGFFGMLSAMDRERKNRAALNAMGKGPSAPGGGGTIHGGQGGGYGF